MKKLIILFSIFQFSFLYEAKAQIRTEVFVCKFVSCSVTYNASPDPSECWEAVEWGIKIPHHKTYHFFSLNYKEIEKIKTKAGENEVQIEVSYYPETSEGGAIGSVKKVLFNGELLFEDK